MSSTTKGLISSNFTITSPLDFWTLTIWQDEKAMLNYVSNGAHLKAMKKFRAVADTAKSRVIHWPVEQIPTWEEAMKRNNEADYDYEKSAAATLTVL